MSGVPNYNIPKANRIISGASQNMMHVAGCFRDGAGKIVYGAPLNYIDCYEPVEPIALGEAVLISTKQYQAMRDYVDWRSNDDPRRQGKSESQQLLEDTARRRAMVRHAGAIWLWCFFAGLLGVLPGIIFRH